MNTAKSFELIVFDWDGTLMDSCVRIVHCMRQALYDCGLPDMSDFELRQVIGLGLHEAVRQLLPAGSDAVIEQVVEAYRARWLSSPSDSSRFFEGIEALLYRLSDKGVLMAVATGKGRRGLDGQFAETDTGHLFAASCCADESLSKPAPDMLLEILETLAQKPEDTLVVGDSIYDMQMARSAGVARLAVGYGVHDAGQLSIYDPIGMMHTPGELVSWFEFNILRDAAECERLSVAG